MERYQTSLEGLVDTSESRPRGSSDADEFHRRQAKKLRHFPRVIGTRALHFTSMFYSDPVPSGWV